MGDRFGNQGNAQLQAVIKARADGMDVAPVWNKSHREHQIIGTSPDDVRLEADLAVKTLNWESQYFVDADHIGLGNVDLFLDASNFFTLDVAPHTQVSSPRRLRVRGVAFAVFLCPRRREQNRLHPGRQRTERSTERESRPTRLFRNLPPQTGGCYSSPTYISGFARAACPCPIEVLYGGTDDLARHLCCTCP